MAQVSIRLGSGTYAVGCENGQEQRVRQLSQLVESKVGEVRAHLAPMSEAHALFLAALLMADENQELQGSRMSEAERKELEEARRLTARVAGETERLAQVAELAEKLVLKVNAGIEAEANESSNTVQGTGAR